MVASPVRFGVFEFDPSSGDLVRVADTRRRTVRLRPKTAQVFASLLAHPGEVVTREKIKALVWSDTIIEFDQGLNACIREIRSALNDNADAPTYLETLPRRGYRFIAPLLDEPGVPSPDPGESKKFRRIALVLSIAVVGLIGFSTAMGGRSGDDAVASREGHLVVAVLPLRSFDSAGDYAYLAEGLTEEFIHHLAAADLEEVGIVARTSSNVYRNSDQTAAAIGSELDADYLLEGGIHADAGVLRADLRLIRVSDELPAWTATYEAPMANRGAALGSELVAELSAFLEKTPRSSLARGPGDGSVDIDSTARDLLFRAGYALEQRGSPSATLAVGYLETLLERDPAHTMAMTVLSRVMFRLGRRAEGVELAGRALATDSTSVDARLLAGELALSTWDWPAARTNLTWAVQHGPGRADTQIQLAYLEGAEGNLDQAARLARTAVRLNPVVPSVRGDIGWLFYYAGELESALEHCSRMLELTPESLGARTCLLLTQLRLGREEEAFGQAGAIAAAEGLDVELPPGASHTTGIEQFLTTAATALVRGSPTPWDRYEAARALALLGREDRALEQLELSVSDGPSLALLYVAVEPAFEALRSNDRFTVLLQNIGLSDLTG